MTAPALWRVSVRAEAAREEEISSRLELRLRASVAVYRDADTGALTISAYPAEIDATPGLLRRSLSNSLRVGLGAVSVERLRRENWATSWRRHFHPLQIGSRLLIKPSWSRRRARPGQRVIILDPGLSFGTGQHPTTAFCLRQLVRRRSKDLGQSFLDIGTGSGILAIAAAKLGYSPAHAFDFDAEAVRASKANLRRNRVADRVSLRQDDLTKLPLNPRHRFDVICANVTYDLLAREAERISRHLSPNGALIAAGILEEQFPIVTKSFQRFGLTLRESKLQNIWRSGQFAFS